MRRIRSRSSGPSLRRPSLRSAARTHPRRPPCPEASPPRGPTSRPSRAASSSLPSTTTTGNPARLGLVVDTDGRLHPRAGLVDVRTDHVLGIRPVDGHDVGARGATWAAAATSRAAPSASCTSSARSRSTSTRGWSCRTTRPSSCRAHQGMVSSCGGTCKVKKPCFLKTWLHHKSGCKAQGLQGVQDMLLLRGVGDDGLVAGPDGLGPVVRRRSFRVNSMLLAAR